MQQSQDITARIISVDLLRLCYSYNLVVIGLMLDPIRNAYSLTLMQTSLLASLQSAAGFVVIFFSIVFLDLLNKNMIFVLAGLIYYLAFSLIGILPPFSLLFGLFILMGISGGMVDTLANAVVADLDPYRSRKNINSLYIMYSVGAIAMPLIADKVFAAANLSGVFIYLGGFALFWALFSIYAFRREMRMAFVTKKPHVKDRVRELINIYKDSGLLITGISSVLYCCWQLTAILYIPSAVSGINNKQSEGAIALTVFFIGMLMSRVLLQKFIDQLSPGLVLAVCSFLGMVFWLLAFTVSGLILKIVFIGLSSFFCGNCFPMNIIVACKLAPKNTATASGTINLGSYISKCIYPLIISALGDLFGLDIAMLFIAAPLLLVIPVALSLHQKLKIIEAYTY